MQIYWSHQGPNAEDSNKPQKRSYDAVQKQELLANRFVLEKGGPLSLRLPRPPSPSLEMPAATRRKVSASEAPCLAASAELATLGFSAADRIAIEQAGPEVMRLVCEWTAALRVLGFSASHMAQIAKQQKKADCLPLLAQHGEAQRKLNLTCAMLVTLATAPKGASVLTAVFRHDDVLQRSGFEAENIVRVALSPKGAASIQSLCDSL